MMIAPAALHTYEQLRTQVLSQGPCGEYGWAVFLRRGMLAWCGFWDRPPERPAPTPRVSNSNPLAPAGAPHQGVVAVLAGMVLALQPEIVHDV